jgi:hypothetical protein
VFAVNDLAVLRILVAADVAAAVSAEAAVLGAAANGGGIASCGRVAIVMWRLLNAYAIIASYDTLLGIGIAANGSLATCKRKQMFFRAAARGAIDAYVRVRLIATIAGNGCDSQREEEQNGGFVHFHNARQRGRTRGLENTEMRWVLIILCDDGKR